MHEGDGTVLCSAQCCCGTSVRSIASSCSPGSHPLRLRPWIARSGVVGKDTAPRAKRLWPVVPRVLLGRGGVPGRRSGGFRVCALTEFLWGDRSC